VEIPPVTDMARAPSTFRQQDVTRAIRAAAAAGVDIARVEVTKAGTIVIVATAAAEPAKQEDVNEWDTALHDKR
jgi:hypothetical protein